MSNKLLKSKGEFNIKTNKSHQNILKSHSKFDLTKVYFPSFDTIEQLLILKYLKP